MLDLFRTDAGPWNRRRDPGHEHGRTRHEARLLADAHECTVNLPGNGAVLRPSAWW
ncbi:MAG: hypothetical protein ACYDGY_07135 [Acidimicrobiales bacterium]